MCARQRDFLESGTHCLLGNWCYHGIPPSTCHPNNCVTDTYSAPSAWTPTRRDHDVQAHAQAKNQTQSGRRAKVRITWAVYRGRHYMDTCGEDVCGDKRVAAGDVVQEVRGRQQSLQHPALRARAAHGRLGVPLCQLREPEGASLRCTSPVASVSPKCTVLLHPQALVCFAEQTLSAMLCAAALAQGAAHISLLADYVEC